MNRYLKYELKKEDSENRYILWTVEGKDDWKVAFRGQKKDADKLILVLKEIGYKEV